MGVSPQRSGLGWGTGPVSLALTFLIVGLVGYLTVTGKDTQNDRTLASSPAGAHRR